MQPLKLKKDAEGWWIIDPNNPECPENGPYETKAEAEDDLKGLERFWKAYR